MSNIEVKRKGSSIGMSSGTNEHQRLTAGNIFRWPITNVAVLAVFLVCLPLVLKSGFHYHLAVLVGINATIAISLNLLMGYAGQVSLGHAGFVALGAYGTAILSSRYGWPVPLALLSSATGAGLIAFLVGGPILRLKGYYLALGTLGLGMIIYLVISNEVWLTGGPDGMAAPVLELFGVRLMVLAGRCYAGVGFLVVDEPDQRSLGSSIACTGGARSGCWLRRHKCAMD